MISSGEILIRLDELRDKRYAKTISEVDYHAEWDRLWIDLATADREEAQEAKERLPKVYCDGFYVRGRPLGIGVFSADYGIEISLQLDEAGTNNVAECLAAITALEECKKRGITGIRLLCDSQLVVYWTKGIYAQNSKTARTYTPTIIQLLSEVDAIIDWIPGKDNLADRYSRNMHMLPVVSPLEKLKTIPCEQLKFKDLLAVKSGRDQFSSMRKSKIIDSLTVDDWELIVAAFDKEKYQLSAARWRLRGLPLDVAIRKIKVEREVGQNYRAKLRASWEDSDDDQIY